MAIRFYDKALSAKIESWIKDPNMTILKPDEVTRLLQIQADKNNDKPIQLPLIALSRDPNVTILSTNKQPLSFDGKSFHSTYNSTKELDAIPIEIHYQLDVYTRHYEEADEYLRNFIFNFINYPKLRVDIPYNNSNVYTFANIRLDPGAADTSDIPQRLVPGQFTRWTLRLTIIDAYLFSIPVKVNVHMDTDNDIEII